MLSYCKRHGHELTHVYMFLTLPYTDLSLHRHRPAATSRAAPCTLGFPIPDEDSRLSSVHAAVPIGQGSGLYRYGVQTWTIFSLSVWT
jgi:hypothetical protein